MNETIWWAYLVRMPNNALYCGITTDVERRFKQHLKGTGAKALRGKSPLLLVWRRPIALNRSDASKIEWRIKQLTKLEKEALVMDHFDWTRLTLTSL